MDQLEDWLGGVEPRLGHLEDFELPGDFPFDFSLGSLERLEVLAVQRFEDWRALTAEEERNFVEGVVTYVGEALLRVAGGSWGWDDATRRGMPELPVVHPDERLGLSAVSPLLLLIEVVEGRAGAFARAYAALREQVENRQVDDPAWTPIKQPTPGLDRLEPDSTGHLRDWLAERERAFPDWVATYGGTGLYDYSPASLDALEAAVRRLVPTDQHLYDSANTDFVDGAVWYLGEVMRGARGGQWSYRSGPPDARSPNIGRPYIQQPTQQGSTTAPILDLKFMLRKGAVGYLRERYADFAQ